MFSTSYVGQYLAVLHTHVAHTATTVQFESKVT